jgi:abnormal spindle-like microcephaly-associated protein
MPGSAAAWPPRPPDLACWRRCRCRERTLALLWALALHLQLPPLLPLPTMRAELERLLATARRQAAPGGQAGGAGAPLAVYLADERLSLLMEWVQAVCLHTDVSVANFTTCFADGRVLCLLVSAPAT